MGNEKFQLRWNCHLSFLNSSVAKLYKNEKFADVVLYTSNRNSGDGSIPTVGISAHKFILSSCSQFFATMFENAPITAPNAVLYVVLPPDLSHRAIQILVQYMYSGVANVTSDILNEVLLGGEILKIRGLCHATTPIESRHTSRHHAHYGANAAARSREHNAATRTQALANNGNIYADIGKSTYSARFVHEPSTSLQIGQQIQLRGLGASLLAIKDSPVIVKSPKVTQMHNSFASHNSNNNVAVGTHAHAGSISVNKEVAIDPENKCCYQSQEPLPAIVSTSMICNELGCTKCPGLLQTERLQLRQSRSHSDESRMSMEQLEQRMAYAPEALSDEHNEQRDDMLLNYEHRLGSSDRPPVGRSIERERDFFVPEPHYEHSTQLTMNQQFAEAIPTRLASPVRQQQQQQSFMPIKQEPTDWSNPYMQHESSSGSVIHNRTPSPPSLQYSPKQPLDFKITHGASIIKMETGSSASISQSVEDAHLTASAAAAARCVAVGRTSEVLYPNFARLLCDICNKSFDDPKSWARHMAKHGTDNRPSATITAAETLLQNSGGGRGSIDERLNNSPDVYAKSYVPKKKRRVSKSNNDHVRLQCDLCATSFETPAEWVRHMSNKHTEVELAVFNKKLNNEQKDGCSMCASAATTTTGIDANYTSAELLNTTHTQHAREQAHHNHKKHKKYSSRSHAVSKYADEADSSCIATSSSSLSPTSKMAASSETLHTKSNKQRHTPSSQA